MTWWRVAVLPALLVVLVAVAAVLPQHQQDSTPASTPVTQTSYACTGGPVVSTGQVDPGDAATATTLGEEPADAPDSVDPDAWVRSRSADPLVVTQDGEGSGAVGFVSGALRPASGGGLVVGACPGVVDDAWFAGLGSGDGHESRVLLTNLGDTPAVVDLRVWGPEGEIDAVDASGVVVEPSTSRSIALADLAAGEPELAVHVQRRRGALAISALDTATTGRTGSELVSPAAGPSRRQVVAGVPGGAAGRTLQLFNPADTTARVTVEAIGTEGTFEPEGLDDVSVEAGSTASVTLPRSAGAAPMSLRLVSTTPVVASVLKSADGDRAVAEAVGRWRGPAVVPLGRGLGTPDLVLSAPGGDAEVVVEARGADLGVLDDAEVGLTGGSTTVVDPADALELEGAAFLVVRPRGTVLGAATFATDDGLASLALQAAPVEVLAPRVRPLP